MRRRRGRTGHGRRARWRRFLARGGDTLPTGEDLRLRRLDLVGARHVAGTDILDGRPGQRGGRSRRSLNAGRGHRRRRGGRDSGTIGRSAARRRDGLQQRRCRARIVGGLACCPDRGYETTRRAGPAQVPEQEAALQGGQRQQQPKHRNVHARRQGQPPSAGFFRRSCPCVGGGDRRLLQRRLEAQRVALGGVQRVGWRLNTGELTCATATKARVVAVGGVARTAKLHHAQAPGRRLRVLPVFQRKTVAPWRQRVHDDPSLLRTTQTVRARILMSSHNDHCDA